MRKIVILLFVVLCELSSYAQVPEKMSYQAVIRNSSNQLISNQPVGMRISVLQGSADGPAVYVETQTPVTNANGLVSLEIGTGVAEEGDFAAIAWSQGPYFLMTEIDPEGGTNYSIAGTSQLLSVPYALHAKTAEYLSGGLAETDPLFAESVASGITGADTSRWNNKPDRYTLAEIDVLKSNIAALERILVSKGFYTVEDIDGNSYMVVIIGEQIWMQSNLRVTRYNDGTPIPLMADRLDWTVASASGEPCYCWYDNDSALYAGSFGALYNWYAVNTGKLCPVGWHVPDKDDWTTLMDYIGGSDVAGGKLKAIAESERPDEVMITAWTAPNTGASNETGFKALPGGYRGVTGVYAEKGNTGEWWSGTTTSVQSILASGWIITYNESRLVERSSNKRLGLSVRCLKD